MDLEQVRARFPQYSALPDEQFARRVHRDHYSDIPFGDFALRIGYVPARQEEPTDPDLEAQKRLAAGGSALGDFGHMAAQGASFGLSDEMAGIGAAMVPGGRGYGEARDRVRQRVSDLRQLAPRASMAAEIAGGVALPSFGASTMAGRMAPEGASIAARMAAGGMSAGIVGAGTGAAYGAGSTDGGPGARARGAVKPGLQGGVAGLLVGTGLPALGAGAATMARYGSEIATPIRAGAREAGRSVRSAFRAAGIEPKDVPGLVGNMAPDGVIADLDPALARSARTAVNQAPGLSRAGGPVANIQARSAQRGQRMARALRDESGLTLSMDEGQEMAEAAINKVRTDHYGPLEEAFPVVDGPNVSAALGERPTPPSFTELQDIMMDLRDDATAATASGRPNASRRARAAYSELVEAMEQDIPGFADAQAAYHSASKVLEGYDSGFSAWTKSAREISQAMEALPPEARDSFRVGLLQRWEEKLLSKEGSTGAVTSITNAGSEMDAQLRAVFPDEDSFLSFLKRRDLEGVFRETESAVLGGSTTARQASDILDDSMPRGKGEWISRIYNALFDPGASRTARAENTGNALLGNDVQRIMEMLRPPTIPRTNIPFAPGGGYLGPGLGGAAGAATGIGGSRR